MPRARSLLLWVCWCACALAGGGARVSAQDLVDVDVVHRRSKNSSVDYKIWLAYDVWYDIEVNNTIEYILEFVQNDVSLRSAPARVMLSSETAPAHHPIMISARQNNGAVMWQLPEVKTSGGHIIRYTSIERTLCPHNNVYHDDNSTAQCDVESTDRSFLHVSTTCSVSVTLRVRVEVVRDFYVRPESEIHLEVTPPSPRYFFYSFEAAALLPSLSLETMYTRWKTSCGYPLSESENTLLQNYRNTIETVVMPPRVHLVIESDDDICAVISIQNYACPVFDNEREILYEGQYLTMMRSGSIQLERSSYPDGFYVVFIAKDSDEECVGERSGPDDAEDALEAVLPPSIFDILGIGDHKDNNDQTHERRKMLRFRIQPSITHGQYALATGLATLFYIGFYIIFVTVALLFRTQFMKRFVHSAPRQPLTPNSETPAVTYIDGVSPSRDGTEEISTIFTSGNANPGFGYDSQTRRSSGATLDSGDMSDTDSDEETRQANGAGVGATRTADTVDAPSSPESRHPFGLPPQLRLAGLARHRARVLRARSDRYLWTVITVAVFYSLPVMQLVATYQRILNTNGDQDLCYYNFLCAHPLGFISDFNHVASNLGYALLGLLFIIQVARRKHRQRANANEEEYGIPQHYGILYAMGVALVVEALLSGSYHICPNQMNFQFDMAFMYVMAVLSMVKIYQSRHPDVNARAHASFGVLALIIALCLWGVISNSTFFWTLFTVLHLSTFLGMSLQIYYVGRFRLKGATVVRAARELASAPAEAVRPLYKTRLVALLFANMANWALAGYGLWNETADFASHLLYILLGNTLLYTFFYIIMKLMNKERILWHAWFFIIGATAFWVPAMYFFTNGSTSWATTPALSRHFNKPCYLLDFFDSHDIWHFLSAIAMFMSFNMLLVWDDGLSGTPRSEIAVF